MGKDNKAKQEMQTACRDYTLHLHKRLQGVQFKKRAPKCIRLIKKFATEVMYTNEVRIDTALNRAVWLNGIRNIPRRIRVRVTRKLTKMRMPRRNSSPLSLTSLATTSPDSR